MLRYHNERVSGLSRPTSHNSMAQPRAPFHWRGGSQTHLLCTPVEGEHRGEIALRTAGFAIHAPCINVGAANQVSPFIACIAAVEAVAVDDKKVTTSSPNHSAHC